MRPLPVACLLLLLTTPSLRAPAQQPFTQLSAADLTQAYVRHAQSVPDPPPQRYTFLILHHDQNFTNGKLTGEQTYLSELVYIAGVPYMRRIERNGKPLQDRELKHEDDLYAQAVQEITALTDDGRRNLIEARARATRPFPLDHLTSDFHPEITDHPVLDGHPCILLHLTPLHPDAPPSFQRDILLTLDASNLNLLQSHVEYLAPDRSLTKGTISIQRYTYVDGTLLPAAHSVDTTVQEKHPFHSEDIRLLGTDTYGHYRRFNPTDTPKSPSTP